MSATTTVSSSTTTSQPSSASESSLSNQQQQFIFDSIKRNDFEQVKLFIQQNPQLLLVCDEQNNLPVHIACRCNHEKIALFLLDRLSSSSFASLSNSSSLSSSSSSTQLLIEMIQRENNEKQSAISLANPKLRGMIKASIEISKMKKLLMEKYSGADNKKQQQQQHSAQQTTLTQQQPVQTSY